MSKILIIEDEEAIADLETGKGQFHDLIEAEDA